MDIIYTSGLTMNPAPAPMTGLPMFISILSRRAYGLMMWKSHIGQWHSQVIELDKPFHIDGHIVKAFSPDTGMFAAVKNFGYGNQ